MRNYFGIKFNYQTENRSPDPSARHCVIGRRFSKCTAQAGEVCKPIAGSIVTECEVKGCQKFC